MPRSALIALAACSFALPSGSDNLIAVQLTPIGDFMPWDGRDIPSGHWHIDQAVASQVIARFAARKNDRVLDYEHQTLHKEENGQPAPAAGWLKGLEWREGEGLFGTVELTARARQLINDGEYKYVSPVFSFDRLTGDVLDIQMAAITNNAAVDGMEPLALRAAATFRINLDDEETPMNKLLLAVCTALALGATTTEDAAVAALNAHFKNAPNLPKIREVLGITDDAVDMVAVCTALKTRAEASSTAAPDPAKFVPVSVVESLKTDLAALTAKVQGADVDALVSAGLEDGRLFKAQEEWARSLGKSDIAALSAYLDTAQPIAALSGSQTGGRDPVIVDTEHKLNAEELAICSATGIAPKDFAVAKAA